jgi:TRAP-type C4-dicarboxylate transport system substrate-binding protein
MTWHGLTINKDSYDKLPDDVKEILHEVAMEYEEQVGIVNKREYPQHLDTLRDKITVTELPADVRAAWAESLADWPQSVASDLESKGLPAVRVLNLALDAAEAEGYKWPVRYVVE